MAARDNDSAAFLTAIRRDSFMAQSGQSDNWSDSRILAIADDCTLEIVAPALKRAKQGWFREDIAITTVASQAAYDVPEEAMWNGFEAIWLIDASSGIISSKIDFVDKSNRQQYGFQTPGVSQYAWMENSQIVFSPAPSSQMVASYSCTASYYRRPAQLVLTTDTARITAVNSVTQALTIAAVPSSWTTDPYTSGTPYRVDLYDKDLPNTRLLWNKTVLSPSATAIQFSPSVTASEFAKISVGDVATMKGTTPYPDLPPDGVPFLRKMVVKSILTSQTDTEALNAYLTQQGEALTNFIKGMGNRSDGSPRKLSLANAGAAKFMRNYRARYRR